MKARPLDELVGIVPKISKTSLLVKLEPSTEKPGAVSPEVTIFNFLSGLVVPMPTLPSKIAVFAATVPVAE